MAMIIVVVLLGHGIGQSMGILQAAIETWPEGIAREPSSAAADSA
jgi:hypothetical protein